MKPKPTPEERITIVGVELRDMYRIRTAHLTIAPGGGVVQVVGKNRQGKTSVVMSVAGVLGGAKKVDVHAVNQQSEDGSGYAVVEMDNGFSLSRVATPNNPKGKLTIQAPDGAAYGQALLDGWCGPLSWDPRAFFSMEEQDQRDLLLSLGTDPELPTKLAAIRSRRALLLDSRSPWISQAQRCERSKRPQGDRPARVDPAHQMERLTGLEACAASRARAIEEADKLKAAALQKTAAEVAKAKDIQELRARLRAAEDAYVSLGAQAADLHRRHQGALAQVEVDHPDVTEAILEVRRTIEEADIRNQALAPWVEWDRVQVDLAEAKAQREALDTEVDVLRDQEKALLQDAGIDIPGLSFNSDGHPLLGTVPLRLASGREKAVFVVDVAERAGTLLGVCLVDEASGIDDEGMAALHELGQAKGFQVWLTRLLPAPMGQVVYVEDGVAWTPGSQEGRP